MARIVWRGLAVVVAALIITVVAALLYRAWRQHENAETLAIHTPNGIEEAGFVRIGGIDQWVQIRGDDRANPVLLFLHGGPGNSLTPASSLLRGWEKTFTVVMWDQRCAGKTFVRNGGAPSCTGMSIASVAHDGISLAEYLRRHLHKNKIVALGVSWGTMVGIRMVKDRPDLFSAWVGSGQVVSVAEKEPVIYAAAIARLRAAHREDGLKALERSGPPPYKSLDDYYAERYWSSRTDIPSERDLIWNIAPTLLFAPGWSLRDLYAAVQGPPAADGATFNADASYDARQLGPKFDLPFFIIQGEQDNTTPTYLAKQYFDTIEAPTKKFIVLEGAGHDVELTMPDAFLHELNTWVRPVARDQNGI